MPPRKAKPHPTSPTPFNQCRMTPVGVWSIVQHLRTQPLLTNIPEDRLFAMAIAFLAQGGTNDGQHHVEPGALHPSHYVAHGGEGRNWRDHLRRYFRITVMDHLTWLDRLSGGASIFVHLPGTRPPDTPAIIEEARLDVYYPPSIVRDFPTLNVVVARVVQYVAEGFAVLVMERWDRAKSLHEGGGLYDPSRPRQPSDRTVCEDLIPRSSTPYHVFPGRTPGTLEEIIARFLQNIPPPINPPLPAASATETAASATRSVTPNAHAPSASTVRSPRVFAPPNTPRVPKYISPENRPDVKLEYDSDKDPWTAEDLAVMVENMEGMQLRETPESPASELDELRRRVAELESIVTTQVQEIEHLHALLTRDMDMRSPTPRSQSAHPSTPSHTGTFGGNKGKGKNKSKGKNTPRNRSRSPSSLSSVSSVSSVTASSASPTPSRHAARLVPLFLQRGAQPATGAPRASHGSGASSSSSASQSAGSSRPSAPPTSSRGSNIIVGFFTDHCIVFHNLPNGAYGIIARIETEFPPERWLSAIRCFLPSCSEAVAQDLVEAMRQDSGLPSL
ncbi:hypothetical protein GSI_03027 [Ganoderma sinense ZZ0214-1]|uniref:Uncharacterized protein n=1 Tax=Ganoderma sinense ZZ0214-1 TaxID=1077348 RepID=A0A2G8SIF4_9APHY|nr:hypothetical protein GSI_04178 [Ganoderma sinense ZZ0214-1]PIL35237.1 hypothetical protein GSI_03027 [Ganoderma sinense ZZ0214-1]